MKLRGRIVFSDGSKFYTYEDLTGKIVPYDLLNEDFPELSDTNLMELESYPHNSGICHNERSPRLDKNKTSRRKPHKYF